MCCAQGPQHSDAGEAQTRDPSVSSQALYLWATALPNHLFRMNSSLRYQGAFRMDLTIAKSSPKSKTHIQI